MAITSFPDIGISSNVQIVGDELVVSDSTAVYFGSPSVNGSYRIVRDGNYLNIERRESGTWVEKEATLP
jgi:hypothetical protein